MFLRQNMLLYKCAIILNYVSSSEYVDVDGGHLDINNGLTPHVLSGKNTFPAKKKEIN